ncbi:MAG: ABC transporter substrate-binding protein [Candidatus Tectomicrobia bacterium]|uniref:ABC transporter substrate-binding protein n=1 Tax=Tectimicrobiota bacterium TaxID=2528274 RepID=A0A933GMN8_UNCTE|nr:ABC transporter substrate-binding protein [Candidatus Tectomicrobia bacterium]
MCKDHENWFQIPIAPLYRRRFLKSGLRAGLGLALSSPLLGLANQALAQTSPGKDDQPQPGGVLTYRLAGDPPNFDPISNATYMIHHAIAPIYNNIVMFDPMDRNRVIGELAHKWEISPDGKIYTFHLIKGVKFHDGKPCTAADVKFTYDLIRNPPQGVVSLRKIALAVIDGIETPDEYTVRFVLKRPAPSMLNILAQGYFSVLPKHIIEAKGDMKKDAIGTGPFKLKNYTRGVSIELVRNPDYHLKGRPYLDGITFFIIPDPGTAFANFRTGQLHFYMMTGDEARQAEKEFGDKVAIQKGPLVIFFNLNFNGRRKPWDDLRVRQAVSLAIDRSEALKVVTMGDGDIGGLMPPSGIWALPPAELEKIPGYGKDTTANISAAKKLLAEAGYANGFATTLLTRKGSDFEPFSVFLKDQLGKIGIEAKLDVQETASAYDSLNKRNFDLAPWAQGTALDDPDAFFGEFYTCNAIRNYSGICSKEVDELFDKQSQTMDLEERKKLVHQMEKAALMNFSNVMIYHQWRFVGLSARARNYKIHSSLFNNQRLQDVWLAKK